MIKKSISATVIMYIIFFIYYILYIFIYFIDFFLGNWCLLYYKLARESMLSQQFTLARALLQPLLPRLQTESFYFWIFALLQLTENSVSETMLLSSLSYLKAINGKSTEKKKIISLSHVPTTNMDNLFAFQVIIIIIIIIISRFFLDIYFRVNLM